MPVVGTMSNCCGCGVVPNPVFRQFSTILTSNAVATWREYVRLYYPYSGTSTEQSDFCAANPRPAFNYDDMIGCLRDGFDEVMALNFNSPPVPWGAMNTDSAPYGNQDWQLVGKAVFEDGTSGLGFSWSNSDATASSPLGLVALDYLLCAGTILVGNNKNAFSGFLLSNFEGVRNTYPGHVDGGDPCNFFRFDVAQVFRTRLYKQASVCAARWVKSSNFGSTDYESDTRKECLTLYRAGGNPTGKGITTGTDDFGAYIEFAPVKSWLGTDPSWNALPAPSDPHGDSTIGYAVLDGWYTPYNGIVCTDCVC